MMTEYFKTQIGKKINYPVVTGNRSSFEVYERVFVIEVLAVIKGKLHVDVWSYDKVPSGYRAGGTDKHCGEFSVSIGNFTKTQIINEILCRADFDFMAKYNVKIAK